MFLFFKITIQKIFGSERLKFWLTFKRNLRIYVFFKLLVSYRREVVNFGKFSSESKKHKLKIFNITFLVFTLTFQICLFCFGFLYLKRRKKIWKSPKKRFSLFAQLSWKVCHAKLYLKSRIVFRSGKFIGNHYIKNKRLQAYVIDIVHYKKSNLTIQFFSKFLII